MSKRTAKLPPRKSQTNYLCVRLIASVLLILVWLSGCGSIKELSQGSKWGFIDTSGKVVIQPQFDEVATPVLIGCSEDNIAQRSGGNGFSEGLAAVNVNGKWGYIDKSGKYVISPQFSLARSFHEGLAFVGQGDNYGYIDKSGTKVIECGKKCARAYFDFSEGLAVVIYTNGKVEDADLSNIFSDKIQDFRRGYIDRSGRVVIPPTYKIATGFFKGVARVNVNQYIDKTGRALSSTDVLNMSGDEFNVRREADASLHTGPNFEAGPSGVTYFKFIFVDKSGKNVFGKSFYEALPFSEGLAAVSVNPERDCNGLGTVAYGYIDTTGNLVIPDRYWFHTKRLPQFAPSVTSGPGYTACFHEGRAVASTTPNKQWEDCKACIGIIDKQGNWIVKPGQYSYIEPYREGRALATLPDGKGLVFLNRDGQVVVPNLAEADSFSEGLAAVRLK